MTARKRSGNNNNAKPRTKTPAPSVNEDTTVKETGSGVDKADENVNTTVEESPVEDTTTEAPAPSVNEDTTVKDTTTEAPAQTEVVLTPESVVETVPAEVDVTKEVVEALETYVLTESGLTVRENAKRQFDLSVAFERVTNNKDFDSFKAQWKTVLNFTKTNQEVFGGIKMFKNTTKPDWLWDIPTAGRYAIIASLITANIEGLKTRPVISSDLLTKAGFSQVVINNLNQYYV